MSEWKRERDERNKKEEKGRREKEINDKRKKRDFRWNDNIIIFQFHFHFMMIKFFLQRRKKK